MNGAGVVQPLAPEPAPVATVTEPDDELLRLAQIEAIIDGLNACMIVFDEAQQKQAQIIINGLEAIKIVAQ